ncbi:MAG: gliding motility-associated protein GldE [Bacteroidetes bacterium]|nr:MAG: gliding motility-associated protein GldE [Bacteroidota bacterium]
METPDPDPYASLISSIISVTFLGIDALIVFELVLLFILLMLSGMISGSETAFFSLRPNDLIALKTEFQKRGELVLKLRETPKTLLATVLVANNLVNVAIVILASYLTLQMVDFGDNILMSFFVQVVLITSLLLLLGEIMPKIYANKEPVRVVLFIAPFLSFCIVLFKPLSSLLVASTSFIDKRFGNRSNNLSMSDISVAIDITSDESTLPEEKKMLKGIASFGEKEVTNVMKSRVSITAIDLETPFEKLLEVILNSGFSRIPVYDGNIDKVMGILYIKDLLPFLNHDDLDWTKMIRPAFFVPENKKINDLLQEFREKKIHMAIVVDEYGGTAGLLTLEDIIEEIVGDISDEFDKESDNSFYRKLSAGVYLFEGKTNLNDVCKVLDLDDYYFEEVQGESDTLAGLLLEVEGRIPEKGAKINCKDFRFEVTDADLRRIKQIKVTYVT